MHCYIDLAEDVKIFLGGFEKMSSMGINEYLRTSAFCAKCGDEISWYGANGITAIKQWLRRNGWSVGKEKILCPYCRCKTKGE